MSYINTKLLKSRNLSLNEFAVLSLLRQNKFENNVDILETELNTDVLKKFEDLNLIEQVKRKNKAQNELELIRTTKKANEWLDDIGTADIIEDDTRLFDWLESVYKSMGKETGNKRKCKNYIAQFRVNSGICRNHLVFLCKTFIDDESQMDFSNKLEFLFFKGANLFSVKFDINQSRLFQYYERQKEFFDNEFSKINNE
jgi:hypothetical protein